MRILRWHVAMTGGLPDAKAIITCTDEDMFWAFLNWLWDWQSWVCHVFRFIPLPKFFVDWEREWDKEAPGAPLPFGSYYGDDLGDLWHLFVCDPVSQFIWPRLKSQGVLSFEMTMDEARERFSYDPSRIQWIEDEIKKSADSAVAEITEELQ